MRTGQLLIAGGAAAFAAASLFGCSSDSRTVVDKKVDLRAAFVSELRGTQSSVQAAEAENYFNSLRDTLVAKCMKDAGFSYRVKTPSSSRELIPDFRDRSYAATYGFGVVAQLLVENPESQDDSGQTSADQASAAFAEELPKCMTKAVDAIRSDAGFAELYGRQQEIVAGVAADPRMQQAESDWRSCAVGLGYDYKSRLEAVKAFVDRAQKASGDKTSLERLQRDEIAAAVATFECSQRRDAVYTQLVDEYGVKIAGSLWPK